MGGAHRLPGAAGKDLAEGPDRFLRRARLLEEAAAQSRKAEQFPIWVSIEGADRVKDAFRLLYHELRKAGTCYTDIQSDPHPALVLIDYFEVSRREEGKREPEALGMVSLYGRGSKEPAVIKISPECPAYSSLFLKALEGVVEGLIGKMAGGGDLDIRVAQQHGPPGPKGEESGTRLK